MLRDPPERNMDGKKRADAEAPGGRGLLWGSPQSQEKSCNLWPQGAPGGPERPGSHNYSPRPVTFCLKRQFSAEEENTAPVTPDMVVVGSLSHVPLL